MNKRTSKVKSSKATWDAFYSMDGPSAISNIIVLVALILFAVSQPDVDDPSTYWALALVAVLFLVAGGFQVQAALRLKRVYRSAKEDRRRIAEGLPLDPGEPELQRNDST